MSSTPPTPTPPEPVTAPPANPYPSFADGPPVPERGRATALAWLVLLLGLAALLTGLGPLLRVQTDSGELTASAFVVPQGLLVVACLLFSGLVAGLSTLPRLKQVRGATPVLHALATAAATVGALLAAFALIVIVGVARPTDLVSGLTRDTELVVGLGWAGITILALAVAQAITAFVALAYDVGLVQTRRTMLLAPGRLPTPASGSTDQAPTPTKADTV
ncbi:DUF5336 domain-containing protein [Rhodococcus sp. NPDC003348]